MEQVFRRLTDQHRRTDPGCDENAQTRHRKNKVPFSCYQLSQAFSISLAFTGLATMLTNKSK